MVKRKNSVSDGARKKTKTVGTVSQERNVDELKWKPVKIDGRLDDFEGFFGLEEVEGVDVVVDKGIVKFKEKAGEKKAGGKSKAGSSDVKPNGETKPGAKQKAKSKQNKKQTRQKAKQNNVKEVKPESVDDAAESGEEDNADIMDDVEDENPFAALNSTESFADASELEWNMEVELSEPVQRALAGLGYKKPTAIQELAIPEIMSGKDVIGKAATGSGKTLAYGIPIVERHLKMSKPTEPKKWPTALVFGPTRELVHQICKHIEQAAQYCPFSGSGIMSITGGLSIQKQQRLLENNPAVVVATPGRFHEVISSSNALIERFKKTEILVLDEADRLIQEGHFKELDKILDLIGRGKAAKRQTLVFSATFQKELFGRLDKKKKTGASNTLASNRDAFRMLQDKLHFKDKKPEFIDSNPAEAVARTVVESIAECGAMEKDLYLYYFLLTYPARTIVFVNSVDSVKRIVPFLKELNVSCFGLHSDMIQKQRLRSLERFKQDDKSVLVATDVAARGLDIPLVQHVIHYHLPRTADMYVHRSGRTGRANEEGMSLILCSPQESAALVKLKRVLYQDAPDKAMALKTFNAVYDVLNRVKPRVALAQQISEHLMQSTKTGKQDSWIKQAADDLGVDLSDDELSKILGDSKKKKKSASNGGVDNFNLQAARAELKRELQSKIGPVRRYLTSGSVNLAHMLVSGKSHDSLLGRESRTALEDLKKK